MNPAPLRCKGASLRLQGDWQPVPERTDCGCGTLCPLCRDMLSILHVPDLIEAIQAENVFCSLCISVTTSINVLSLSALAAD